MTIKLLPNGQKVVITGNGKSNTKSTPLERKPGSNTKSTPLEETGGVKVAKDGSRSRPISPPTGKVESGLPEPAAS